MKALERVDEVTMETVQEFLPYIKDRGTLNISFNVLDDLWRYWLKKFHFNEWCSCSYMDYRWNGDWEESFIKYDYIRKFLDWLEDVDTDDIDKMLSEE